VFTNTCFYIVQRKHLDEKIPKFLKQMFVNTANLFFDNSNLDLGKSVAKIQKCHVKSVQQKNPIVCHYGRWFFEKNSQNF
jgi:hypothetical protein